MQFILFTLCKTEQAIAKILKDFHCTVATRASAHGLLAGRCELQCVDCVRPEEWCCHLHVCGGLNDFPLIRVLKVQQFDTQAIHWALLACFCYVYTMEFEQKPRGLTPKPRPFGRMEVRWNTIYGFDMEILWLDPVSGVQTISLLVFLHDELLGMLKAFFAGFLLR